MARTISSDSSNWAPPTTSKRDCPATNSVQALTAARASFSFRFRNRRCDKASRNGIRGPLEVADAEAHNRALKNRQSAIAAAAPMLVLRRAAAITSLRRLSGAVGHGL